MLNVLQLVTVQLATHIILLACSVVDLAIYTLVLRFSEIVTWNCKSLECDVQFQDELIL